MSEHGRDEGPLDRLRRAFGGDGTDERSDVDGHQLADRDRVDAPSEPVTDRVPVPGGAPLVDGPPPVPPNADFAAAPPPPELGPADADDRLLPPPGGGATATHVGTPPPAPASVGTDTEHPLPPDHDAGLTDADVVPDRDRGAGPYSDADGGADFGADTGADAGRRSDADAGADFGADAGADADRGADFGADAGADEGRRSDADAGADLGADAGADEGRDADRDSDPGVGSGPVSGVERVGSAEESAERAAGALLAAGEVDRFRSRWLEVQTGFVDSPRDTVRNADQLTGELLDHLTRTFTEERHRLEQQWDGNDDVATDDLRAAFQRYRSFFDRLLAT